MPLVYASVSQVACLIGAWIGYCRLARLALQRQEGFKDIG